MQKVLGGFGLLAGATYPFRVLAVFKRKPQLLGYVAVPILVNFIVGVALYAGLLIFGWESVEGLLASLSQWLDTLITKLPPWLGFLEYLVVGFGFLLHFLLIAGLLLLIGFVLVQFGVLLGAPWYGQLSEKLEELRTGQLHVVEVGIVRDIGRALLFELKKLMLLVGVGLLLLLLNLAPGIGTIAATVGGIALAATLVCLDFLDAPLERRRLRFRDKLGLVFRSLPASASFSLVCLGLVSVPLLNLLTIPLCVASGTLFFCDRISPKLPKPPSALNSR
ncbi:MAG: EI24 domain-containing protein [Coleofasciculus sp. S288]|nr:EI24 domain-containing protein [Coleofasciculus sp. S288]